MKRIIVTGGAGFIGSNLIEYLLKDAQVEITCIDNFDVFYDRSFKEENLTYVINNPNFIFIEETILNLKNLTQKLKGNYDAIVHIAAKAGVRPSIANPSEYLKVNIEGTQNMLELAKQFNVPQFVFASSSSVYGINDQYPWNEVNADYKPISPYASSKLSAELIGHVYSNLYNIRFIGLRFFTVFGPRQRPDLAIYQFVDKIINAKPINVFGNGDTLRDYTYVDDIVEGIVSALNYSKSSFEIINLGNNTPIKLLDLISIIEDAVGEKALINRKEKQLGDVDVTYADINKAKELLNYQPKTSVPAGVKKFVEWYKKNRL